MKNKNVQHKQLITIKRKWIHPKNKFLNNQGSRPILTFEQMDLNPNDIYKNKRLRRKGVLTTGTRKGEFLIGGVIFVE